MTRKCAKALLPFITAYAEGKTIQVYDTVEQKWFDVGGDSGYTDNFSEPIASYRIKPEPKLVPMTSDDFPPVFWLRRKSSQDITYLVQSIDTSDGEMWIEDGASVKPCDYPDWEYSADRKTWHSLMKEVTE